MIAQPHASPCAVCGAALWTPLPDPGAQSMASDWRVVPEPLGRCACDTCGLARRWPGAAADASLYARGYGLYAHAPGDAREHARQAHYAAWIASAVPSAPAQVLDVGCGNGTLLLALAEHWPAARLAGCDPSAESVAHGTAPGLRLWQGTGADLPRGTTADLVVSVNVIEHTSDPLAFLQGLRGALAHGGTLVVVCPDGGRPGLELLFADHVFSFAPTHLRALCARSGLDVVAAATAPDVLGAFQMVVARSAPGLEAPGLDVPGPGAPDRASPPAAPDLAVSRGRAAYLAAWRDLDGRLLERVPGRAVCFGAGEAAGLLRAYAPRTWSRVRACTVDGTAAGQFGDLPLVPLEAVGPDDTVLVGVRPFDQRRVAERLRGRFARVATWYDLLDGGDGGW